MNHVATNLLGGDFEHFAVTYNGAVDGFIDNPKVPVGQIVAGINFAILHRDQDRLRRALGTARSQLAMPGTGREAADREFLARMTDPRCDPLATFISRTTDRGRVVSLNLARQGRPQRHAGEKVTQLKPTFDYDKMGFFLNVLGELIAVETWNGYWKDMQVGYFPNKHPSGRYHFMAVPEFEQRHPQYLTRRLVFFVWELSERVHRVLPKAVIGINPHGGRGSLLQFHVQIMGDGEDLTFSVNLAGTGIEVPTFGHPEELWRAVDWLQRHNLPFNLILAPESVEIVLRQFQGVIEEGEWTTGFGFNEWRGYIPVAGGLATYHGLTDTMIDDQSLALALPQRIPALV
jgi:hypothetical protein